MLLAAASLPLCSPMKEKRYVAGKLNTANGKAGGKTGAGEDGAGGGRGKEDSAEGHPLARQRIIWDRSGAETQAAFRGALSQ